MLYTIKNEALKVVIDNHGAELHSIQTLDGTEYLWQGDPAVWNGQAPNLFPYVARLTDQKYTFEGKEYSMKIHGFINAVDLYVETEERDQITFRYDSGEETADTVSVPVYLPNHLSARRSYIKDHEQGRKYRGETHVFWPWRTSRLQCTAGGGTFL